MKNFVAFLLLLGTVGAFTSIYVDEAKGEENGVVSVGYAPDGSLLSKTYELDGIWVIQFFKSGTWDWWVSNDGRTGSGDYFGRGVICSEGPGSAGGGLECAELIRWVRDALPEHMRW